MMRITPNPFADGGLEKRVQTVPLSQTNQREMIGLLGSLLIFLMGIPGRSETWVASTSTVVRHLIRLVLVFLGLSTPVVQAPSIPARIPPPARIVSKPRPLMKTKPMSDSMMFHTMPFVHHFNYIFEGKATFHHEPCAMASVLVRLISGEQTAAKGAVTESDGSYRIEIPIEAEGHASVDWTIEAFTADFDKVELSGRKIVQREEEETQAPIIVNAPVEFVVSLSK